VGMVGAVLWVTLLFSASMEAEAYKVSVPSLGRSAGGSSHKLEEIGW
jgi:hypothetical protein